jgi:hypothetical protein
MALRPGWRLAPCAVLLLAWAAMPAARAALFKYVDPLTRMASYSNYRPAQPGARELVLRIDAPRRRAPGNSRAPAAAAAPMRGPAIRGPAIRGPAIRGPAIRGPAIRGPAIRGPANFPRVDAARQRERDSDRRHILDTELRSVEAELARLLAGGAAPEHIGRRRADVAALRRELERLP